MRVVVTGAAGFIGRRLVRELVSRGRLRDAMGHERAITDLLLLDRTGIDLPDWNLPPEAARIGIRTAAGDLADADFRARAFAQPFDSLFHLAATLTTDAERDIELGLRVNVGGLLDLLSLCRQQAAPPKVVFASSIATFGGALPETVEDDCVQRPQTSYGTHKVIAEMLLDDHSRHGVLDGRSLRLPIVLIRPGNAVDSVSDRVAAVLREPLRGEPVACPLPPESWLTVASVGTVARGLIGVHELPREAFGPSRAINLPALSVTIAMMIESLRRTAGERRLGPIGWAPDEKLIRIVAGWPKHFDSARARRLGILPDADMDAIIQDYLSHEGAA